MQKKYTIDTKYKKTVASASSGAARNCASIDFAATEKAGRPTAENAVLWLAIADALLLT